MTQRILAALLMLLWIGSASAEDDAQIKVVCNGPTLEQNVAVHRNGHAKSPPFLMYVYTEPTGRPIPFLGKNDPIVCRATINDKYTITGGRIDIDPASVYTDFNRATSSKPDPKLLLTLIQKSVGQPQVDTIDFTFRLNTDEYKGSFGAVFIIDYQGG